MLAVIQLLMVATACLTAAKDTPFTRTNRGIKHFFDCVKDTEIVAVLSSASLQSPDYPDVTPRLTNCPSVVRKYKAPKGFVLSIICPVFNIYETEGCRDARFTVSDGYTMSSSCGSSFTEFVSSGPTLTVRYYSLTNSAPAFYVFQQPEPFLFSCYIAAKYADRCDCGTPGKTRSGRIIGGSESIEGKFPWQGLLKKQGLFTCGAVLIGKTWALTSATCVDNVELNYEFHCGLFNRSATNGISRTVKKIIKHPNLEVPGSTSDIALIQFNQPIETFTQLCRPVCLPYSHISYLNFDNIYGILTGWGVVNGSLDLSDILKQLDIKILPSYECLLIKLPPDLFSETYNLCSTFSDSDRPCVFDEGGGLVWKNLLNYRSYLLGILFDANCNNGENPLAYYVKITAFLDWITEQTGEMFCSPVPIEVTEYV